MTSSKDLTSKTVDAIGPQQANREWWEANPMTYDWEKTLKISTGTLEWYEEIDRRFFESAYYANGEGGRPFGRFLEPQFVNGKEVLEIGCGMGTHSEMLVRNGALLTAIDQTKLAVEYTRRRLTVRQLDAHVLQEDAERLTFQEKAFDFVWTWGVIHHSSSTERCVDEIARVLRPGGRLMMMVYYRSSLVYYLHCCLIRGILMGQLLRRSVDQIYLDSTDGFYARVFTQSELRELLSQHFHSLKITVVGLKAELYPIPRTKFKVVLERVTPNWIAEAVLGRFGSMVVVEAIRS